MVRCLLTCFLLCASAAGASDQPNIVLIVCDNLGYGDIEPFWSETPHRTPNLTRMAKEGRRFTHFYVTAGVCTPSRASIMTGCYAQRVGMHKIPVDDHVLRPVSPYGLNPDEVTVAEVLKKCGYATTLIGKWHLGDQPEFLPTRQGFDSYYGIPYSDDMTAREWKGRKWPPLPLMEDNRVVEAPADRNTLTKRYTDRAIEFMEQNKEGPFFLFLSHAMPGSTREPYASKAFQGRSKNGKWGDSVEEIDWSTGQILDALKKLGIDDNTLVIWTSDNGAPNLPDSLARGTNKPLFGRGYTTTEGGMRVPTIVRWPGKVPADTTCAELTTTMDFLPTFATLAGGAAPSDRKIDGKDIRPLLFGEDGAASRYDAFYYYQGDQLQAIRIGKMKMFLPLQIPHRHGRFRKGPTQPMLFDVVNDTACAKNLLAAGNVAETDAVRIERWTERFLAAAAKCREDLGDTSIAGAGQRKRGETGPATARILHER